MESIMRPKDLKPPFSWHERQVVSQDGVLYVPGCCESYDSWTFPGWNAIFSNDQSVHLEYCSGNGDWIVEKARAEPEKNWVAVEKRFDRVQKIWSKMRNAQLDNLFICCGEAHLVTRLYLPDASLEAVYINFPDPWPKQRHAKHRLTTSPFIEQLRRTLVPDGTLTFVTDDEPYAESFLAQMEDEAGFAFQFAVDDLPGYGGSWFEHLWRGKGKEICYTRFAKELACAV
jgi:tRNA (guanine-N7-)-methyltransferase